MSNLLDEMELGTLKGMVLYWQELFERDDQVLLQHSLASELNQVAHLLGTKKVLQIIAEYVEGVANG